MMKRLRKLLKTFTSLGQVAYRPVAYKNMLWQWSSVSPTDSHSYRRWPNIFDTFMCFMPSFNLDSSWYMVLKIATFKMTRSFLIITMLWFLKFSYDALGGKYKPDFAILSAILQSWAWQSSLLVVKINDLY